MILHPMILHHSKFDTVCIIEKMHLYWLSSALPMFQSRLVTSLESIDKRLYSEHPHMIEPFLKMDNLHRNSSSPCSAPSDVDIGHLAWETIIVSG